MNMPPRAYRTTVRDALVAVGVATTIATALVTLANWAILQGMGKAVTPGDLLILARNSAFNCLVTMAMVAPLWWWLDRKGYRRWLTAMLVGGAGGALTLSMVQLVAAAWSAQAAPHFDLGMILLGAVPGAVVGLFMWRIAYWRVPDADDLAETF